MSLMDCAVTLEELINATQHFVKQNCEKSGDHLEHKECGGAIRIGFLNSFYINDDGSLDPGEDGFGIGPISVPYCERCFPPDGFNHSYAVRFPILRERKERDRNYQMTWGNKQTITGLLE